MSFLKRRFKWKSTHTKRLLGGWWVGGHVTHWGKRIVQSLRAVTDERRVDRTRTTTFNNHFNCKGQQWTQQQQKFQFNRLLGSWERNFFFFKGPCRSFPCCCLSKVSDWKRPLDCLLQLCKMPPPLPLPLVASSLIHGFLFVTSAVHHHFNKRSWPIT